MHRVIVRVLITMVGTMTCLSAACSKKPEAQAPAEPALAAPQGGSCGPTQKASGPWAFQPQETTITMPGCEGVRCVTIKASWPKAISGQAERLRFVNHALEGSVINHLLGLGLPGRKPSGQLSDAAEGVFAAYQHQAFRDGAPEAPWTIQIEGKILRHNDRLLVAGFSFTDQLGGKATETGSTMNLDLKTGQVLGYEQVLSDRDAFLRLAEAAFKKSKGLKPGASLAEAGFFEGGTFRLPKQFALLEAGLLLDWNAGEISPAGQGPVSLTLPAAELISLVKPELLIKDPPPTAP